MVALTPPAHRRRSRRLGRPKTPDCITFVEPNGALSAMEIWSVMSRSEDWFPNMHPRSPMALAIGRDWVFKANLTKRSLDRRQAESELLRMIRLTIQLGIWHPAKTWFLLHDRRRYVPCNATPVLPLIEELGWLARYRARMQMRAMEAIVRRAGLKLDLRDDNFGLDRTNQRLYYLDDEVYRLRS